MTYNSETEKWAILLECPKRSVSVAVANGQLSDNNFTKSILSLTNSRAVLSHTEQQKWTKHFPPMMYYHNLLAITCTSTSLIVARGWGPDNQWAPVEIMDTNTLCWPTATSLPYPLGQAMATICGDRINIAGGFLNNVQTNKVLMYVLSDLVQSTTMQARLTLLQVSNYPQISTKHGRK